MSEEINIPDDAKQLVDDIIKRYNLDPPSKVTYGPGSELGDGFASRTYTVDIEKGDESLNLFVKCSINMKVPGMESIAHIYANEMYFYDVIIPAYQKFVEEKSLTDAFPNIPKCYGTVPEKVVALENLKLSGFDLCDKNFVGNEQHVELVFKTFAKFHGIGFAYKDQKKEEYEELASGMSDAYTTLSEEAYRQRFEAILSALKDFFGKLDERRDKFILDQTDHIIAKLSEIDELVKRKIPHGVITQADCWCNNMMFKYEGDKRYPLDIKLVDWQVIRSTSPVLDLCYFFYTAAGGSKQSLKRIEDFLETYHDELSAQIRKLGSDPDKIYPLSLLKKEWTLYSSHGFFGALLMLRVMLGKKEDMPDAEKVDLIDSFKKGALSVDNMGDEYISSLRNLAQHFILNEFF